MQNEDRVAKYIRLFGMMFFTFIGIIVSLVIILFLLQFFMRILNKFSVTDFIYNLVMVLIPSSFFITVSVYYWKRTLHFPKKIAKFISFFIFSVMIIAWSVVLVTDLIHYFQTENAEIKNYTSFSLYMLAGSVGLIFLTGIIQALALPVNDDWLAKANARNDKNMS